MSVAIVDYGSHVETLGYVLGHSWNASTGVITLCKKRSMKMIDTHTHKVIVKKGNTVMSMFANGQERVYVEECTYPMCNCPFDMGADNKCLRGFSNAK